MALFNQSYINIGSQFGAPLFGVAGTKPFTGNFFWVDQTNGSDGNTGGPQDPLKTLAAAHSKCLANNNDVVFLTGTAHQTATLVWSKARTHLIGLDPDAQVNPRARISVTGSTPFTPLVSVTASGCIFENIGSFHGFADDSAQICWQDSGGNNTYRGCAFLGMANATAANHVGGRSLKILTGGENYFERCQIGLDTITRSAANATLEFASGTPRNTFRNCIFPALTDDAGALFIVASAAASMDRFQWFQDCLFANAVNSTSTTMTAAITMAASAGGMIVLQRSTAVGVTDWATDAATELQVWIDGAPPTNNTSGLAVKVEIT